MAEIIWSEPALRDLSDIANYIALDKPSAAKAFVLNAFETIGRLEPFPESGRYPPEIDNQRYREVIAGPCRIFYRYEQDQVYILYVMRSERELRNYILAERDE